MLHGKYEVVIELHCRLCREGVQAEPSCDETEKQILGEHVSKDDNSEMHSKLQAN